MSKPDWMTIKGDYVETNMTLAEVQAKHNVPRGTLSARATRKRWHDEKQQFAANLEQQLREKALQERAAMKVKFDNSILKIVGSQLSIIAKKTQSDGVNTAEVLKLANALEKVQRIGCTAFGGK